MSEEPKDYFEDFQIKRTPRFKSIPIFDRDVTVRVKFSVRETGELNKLTSKFAKIAGKMDEHSTPQQIESYEASVNECIKFVVKTPEDQQYVSDLVLASDPESEDILELSDFLEIIRRVQKIDDEAAEEDSGKASGGSDNS